MSLELVLTAQKEDILCQVICVDTFQLVMQSSLQAFRNFFQYVNDVVVYYVEKGVHLWSRSWQYFNKLNSEVKIESVTLVIHYIFCLI